MKKGNLPPKERKRLARLKKELYELGELAYKLDGNDGYEYGDRLNDRYNAKDKEINRLKLLNGK